MLPNWIKIGNQAMLGTKYTTKGFRTKRALTLALVDYRDLGNWMLFKETNYTKNGKPYKQYVGIIFEKD